MTASKILAMAISFLGMHESPANSNNVQFNTEYYGGPVSGAAYPWCCAFVWGVFQKCGAAELFCGGQKTAWCPFVESYAKAHNQWVTKDFIPGDCMLFNFQGGTLAGHIGIVEKKNADGSYTCIEGNTSVTSDDNGGEVMRRVRYAKNILGAFRPAYTPEVHHDDPGIIGPIGDAWYKTAQEWVLAENISDGTRPDAPVTRAEVWQMFYNYSH